MDSKEAPILFITFTRLDTTRVVWEMIKKWKPKKLYFSSDGPRKNKYDEDLNNLNINRKLVEEVDWDCDVQTRFLSENQGCGMGGAGAISWAFENEEKLVIIEDDCLPSFSFFRFCNELLSKYNNEPRVMHIAGTRWNEEFPINDCDFFYTKFAHIWGWATWKRAWQLYDYEMTDYSLFLEKKILNTALCNNPPLVKRWKYMFDTLYNTKKKHIWDYQWQFTMFKHNGLSINSTKNLVTNIGVVGTHSSDTDMHYRTQYEANSELKAPAYLYPEYGFDSYHGRKFFLRDRNKLKIFYDYLQYKVFSRS